VREKVFLVGLPFLALCDYLMHRALFCTKVVYEDRVSAKCQAAFIEMSWESHCTPAARQDLTESWKNYVTYRQSNPRHTESLPVGRATKDGHESDP
jgi:hypothetical protein